MAKPKKKTVIIYSVAGALAISLGVGAGLLAASLLKGAKVDYSNINVDNLTEDVAPLLARYREVDDPASHDMSTFFDEPYQMVNVASALFMEQKNYAVAAVGNSEAMGLVNQGIYALHLRSGDTYFEESISNGMVNVYDRMIEVGDSTTTIWGSDDNYAAMAQETMTNEEYAEKMGRKVSDLTSYIISSKTVLKDVSNSGQPVTGVTRLENGGYQVELELDPVNGVVNYVTQMQTISNLVSKPAFSYCHLTYILDENMHLVSSISYESYYAKISSVLGSICVAKLESKYQWGAEVSIPTVNDKTSDYYNNFASFDTGDMSL